MSDPLDVSRIDALGGRASHDAVDPTKRRNDREQKRRRQPHPGQAQGDTDSEDDERQVGTKLDVRA